MLDCPLLCIDSTKVLLSRDQKGNEELLLLIVSIMLFKQVGIPQGFVQLLKQLSANQACSSMISASEIAKFCKGMSMDLHLGSITIVSLCWYQNISLHLNLHLSGKMLIIGFKYSDLFQVIDSKMLETSIVIMLHLLLLKQIQIWAYFNQLT